MVAGGIYMETLLNIEKAAEMTGVCKATLRRWDKEGFLNAERTKGGHRRYRLSEIEKYLNNGIENHRSWINQIQESLKENGINEITDREIAATINSLYSGNPEDFRCSGRDNVAEIMIPFRMAPHINIVRDIIEGTEK